MNIPCYYSLYPNLPILPFGRQHYVVEHMKIYERISLLQTLSRERDGNRIIHIMDSSLSSTFISVCTPSPLCLNQRQCSQCRFWTEISDWCRRLWWWAVHYSMPPFSEFRILCSLAKIFRTIQASNQGYKTDRWTMEWMTKPNQTTFTVPRHLNKTNPLVYGCF